MVARGNIRVEMSHLRSSQSQTEEEKKQQQNAAFRLEKCWRKTKFKEGIIL